MSTRRRKLGFTLAELLVVVAIIAVLVGVSIPIFSAQTKKAKIATVRANIRSAKAAAYDLYLTEGFQNANDAHGYYVYDTKTGTAKLLYSGSDWQKYGGSVYDKANSASNIQYAYIFVYIKATNTGNSEKTQATLQSCPSYDSSSNTMIYELGEAWKNGN